MKFKQLSGRNDVYVTVRRKVTYVLQQKGSQPLLDSFWNSGRMACCLSIQRRLQLIMVQEKMGLKILISSVSCLENQENIIITVTFNIYHITWQGRKNYYEVRTRKLKWDNLVPFYVHLWSQILVHLQVQQFQILFALYEVNMTPLTTFMLLGNFMCLNRN